MGPVTRRSLARGALAAPLVGAGGAALAAYPERSVRLLVGYSAGGVADTVTRMLQPKVSEHLGQSLIIENRTGASGAIASAAVAQAPADGYTLLFEGSTIATLPVVARSLPLDYDAALTPVALTTWQPYILGVRPGLAVEDMAGLIAEAKRRPGQITYGTPGVAQIGHFMGELLQMMAGIKLEHIPFRGGADVARELAAGRIDLGIISFSSLRPAVERGARLIGSTAARRQPSLPAIPAIAETVPGYELVSWNGIFGPTGIPPDAIARFTAAMHHALRDAPTVDRLMAIGVDPLIGDVDAFRRLIAQDREVARRIVAATGLQTG